MPGPEARPHGDRNGADPTATLLQRGTRRPIEDEKYIESANDLALVFESGGTIRKYEDDDKQRGFWWNRGIIHWDVLAMLETDVPDTPGNRAWFEAWAAEVLLERFHQDAIYLKFVGGNAAVTTRIVMKREPERT